MDLLNINTSDRKQHFTSFRPRWYKKMLPKWTTAWAHYEADFSVLRTKKYLIQRIQGESLVQFKERLITSDYLPLFGTTVDSLVGRMMSIEPIDRVWEKEASTKGLGNITDEESIAHSIWRDADGQGTNYLTLIEDMAIRACVLNSMWVYVRGVDRDDDGKSISDASITLIEPAAVVNILRDEKGNPIDVLVEGAEDSRASIEDPFDEKTVYTRFTLEGSRKYVVTEERGQIKVTPGELEPYGKNGFFYYTKKSRLVKQLPIFEAKLPLRRFVGNILAEKNGVLFNQESERDNILRIACTPLFIFVGNNKSFQNAQASRARGDNAMQLDPAASQPHYYASPPTAPAELRTTVLRDKVADFFVSAFRFYEDSIRGKQKTATEIGQDAASGEGSFLNTLATTLDEAENNIGWRIEQITFPKNPELWGQFHAQRARDFKPIDPVEEADRLANMIFGPNPVPVGDTGRMNAVRKIATAHKLEIVDEEVKSEIKAAEKERAENEEVDAQAAEGKEETEGDAGEGDEANDE